MTASVYTRKFDNYCDKMGLTEWGNLLDRLTELDKKYVSIKFNPKVSMDCVYNDNTGLWYLHNDNNSIQINKKKVPKILKIEDSEKKILVRLLTSVSTKLITDLNYCRRRRRLLYRNNDFEEHTDEINELIDNSYAYGLRRRVINKFKKDLTLLRKGGIIKVTHAISKELRNLYNQSNAIHELRELYKMYPLSNKRDKMELLDKLVTVLKDERGLDHVEIKG